MKIEVCLCCLACDHATVDVLATDERGRPILDTSGKPAVAGLRDGQYAPCGSCGEPITSSRASVSQEIVSRAPTLAKRKAERGA